MNWKLYVRCLKVVFFLDDAKKMDGIFRDTQGCVQNHGMDDSKIYVDDTVPDFLRHADESTDNSALNTKENTIGSVETLSSTSQQAIVNDNHHEDISPQNEHGQDTKSTMVPVQGASLDNVPLVQMFEQCGSLLKELDRIKPGFDSEDSQDLMEIVREHLIQAMCLSGGKMIDNETKFDILRHTCKGVADVNDGDEIMATIEPGISLEDRVIVKAQVQVKNKTT